MSETQTDRWVAVHSSVPVNGWIYANPLHLVRNLWQHRELIVQLTRREVASRYKGSYLGLLWSFLTPLLLLCVFTLFFVGIYGATWKGDPRLMVFPIGVFCGLIAYTVFAECVGRAPSLIVNSTSYVKRVVFPLEVMPIAVLGSALLHAAVSMIPLLAGIWIFMGQPPTWRIVLIPAIFLQLALLTLGVSWFLASLGVFLRDIQYAIAVVLQLLFFTSPVFWWVELPRPGLQVFVRLNPLADIIDDFRRVTMEATDPSWQWFALVGIVSLVVAQLGYFWFMKSKTAFADVI